MLLSGSNNLCPASFKEANQPTGLPAVGFTDTSYYAVYRLARGQALVAQDQELDGTSGTIFKNVNQMLRNLAYIICFIRKTTVAYLE